VADANPGLLRLDDRSLAIDGVREVILRSGQQIADLRRRSLLKRLLFLFAASPATTFSKEDIVQTVWEVEYHPLRHDAALFTNIMRIRRLLGDDGADIIRVSEEGYRFIPPADFLFVDSAEA
jgi:DNA-binding response OmpR family regulator